MKKLSYNRVIKIIKEYSRDVLSKHGIKVHFTKANTIKVKGVKAPIVFGMNNAYCTFDRTIYIFTKDYYDSPELMAMCFAHEVCHVEDMHEKEYENLFADELKIWGRTLGKLYDIFQIKPTKEMQNSIMKSLEEYNKIS